MLPHKHSYGVSLKYGEYFSVSPEMVFTYLVYSCFAPSENGPVSRQDLINIQRV
jgi:hypothetical protein